MEMLPETLRAFVGTTEDLAPSPLADMLVALCHEFSAVNGDLGIALAAAFDLYVASEYYDYVRPEKWLWCEDAGLDVYQYANACPFCVFSHEFIQHDGHKPPSGVIGSRTAAALPEIVRHHYRHTDMSEITVTSGHEPVDLAVIDGQARKVFLAEVKASPLFTPPIAVDHDEGGLDPTGRLPEGHSIGTLRRMGHCSALLLYPDETDQPAFIELPTPGIGDKGWAAKGMQEAFGRDPDVFFDYVRGWRRMWHLYLAKDDEACSTAAFWLTGGCGGPPVIGDGWPTNGRGKPQGSISDSKTSVGMDRTDDIKKGTFQVLMMGVDLHQLSMDGWELRVGLASNLHAGRHHEDYLRRYENIAWGWLDANGEPPSEWYRLFDAIVSFSRSFTEDPWLQEVLNWH